MILRKNYITFKRFQYKYMAWTLFLSFLVALFSAAAVFILVSTFVSNFDYRGPGQVQVMEQVIHLGHRINVTIMIGFLVVFPLIAILTMYMSHRLTGPLMRLKELLNKVSMGVYPDSFTIRDDDALGDLVTEVNAMLKRLKTNSIVRAGANQETLRLAEEIKKEIGSLMTRAPELSKNFTALKKLADDLDQSLAINKPS